MQKALQLAKEAALRGEIPIGAVVVNPEGLIIGDGYNQVEKLGFQGEHAEIRALRSAAQKIENWRLAGCALYVTLEPCTMCMGLAGLSRIERVIYGADSPLFGYRLDNQQGVALYTSHIKGITSGILADESAELLRDFFTKKRMG